MKKISGKLQVVAPMHQTNVTVKEMNATKVVYVEKANGASYLQKKTVNGYKRV
jgi:tartrate dehydratase beta subunit/fumarate hydratase class I family protein